MAFIHIQKTAQGKRYEVRQGDTGRLVEAFEGPGAKAQAHGLVKRLHQAYNPKDGDRGPHALRRWLNRVRYRDTYMQGEQTYSERYIKRIMGEEERSRRLRGEERLTCPA